MTGQCFMALKATRLDDVLHCLQDLYDKRRGKKRVMNSDADSDDGQIGFGSGRPKKQIMSDEQVCPSTPLCRPLPTCLHQQVITMSMPFGTGISMPMHGCQCEHVHKMLHGQHADGKYSRHAQKYSAASSTQIA